MGEADREHVPHAGWNTDGDESAGPSDDRERELDALADDVIAFFDVSDPDCPMSMVSTDIERNRIVVGVITADAQQLGAALAERFGERVELDVIATERWSPGEIEFDGWLIDRSGLKLTVTLLGGDGERDYRLEIVETAQTVEVRVLAELYNGASSAVGIRIDLHATLASPLGERTVIDAVAGQPRRRGRNYEPGMR